MHYHESAYNYYIIPPPLPSPLSLLDNKQMSLSRKQLNNRPMREQQQALSSVYQALMNDPSSLFCWRKFILDRNDL